MSPQGCEKMAQNTLTVDRDCDVPMRDGVVLKADIYRPQTPEPLPVILQRTPYGKGYSSTSFALIAAERGYAVVIQDTRGRWASEGDGYPLVHEKVDGYDTLEWITQQPWSNGKVGMCGMSYLGYTQFAAAVSRHPALKTIIPCVTFCNGHSVAYYGGAFTLGVSVSWNLVSTAMMEINRRPGGEAEKANLMNQIIQTIDGMSQGKSFSYLPLKRMPLIGQDGLTTCLADWVGHPLYDEYWQELDCPHQDVTIPVMHIGGWYDLFIAQTLRDYTGILGQGNTNQKLLIGPWVHGSYAGQAGEVDFGVQGSDLFLASDEMQLNWFDHWLKDAPDGVTEEKPIRIFVMGQNCWRDESEWPLARTQYTNFYLHSGGAANSLSGDGTLTIEPPSVEPVDTYVYDPRNPTPTRGGGLCCWEPALPPGAFDQRGVETRPDVLVYTTPPLDRDLEVTGPLKAELWASTSAVDTDFTAKLVDVGPCGYARNLQDGIIRARYRDSSMVADPIQPGKIYQYTIDLGATSNLFKAGHRIRLEISSSNFPRFDRNLNTGKPVGDDSEIKTALQTLIHDAEHPSHVTLPVIPAG
jgi:putative CocE/NonD family hydrolase